MDVGFANQALASEYLFGKHEGLDNVGHRVPQEPDDGIGSLELAAVGIEIDSLTPEHEAHLAPWHLGT